MKTMSYPGFKPFGGRLERFFNGSQDRVELTRRKIGHLMQKVSLWRYGETPRWVTSGFCKLSDLTQNVDRMIETLTAVTANQLRLLRRTGAILDGLSIDSRLIDARLLAFANEAWLTFGGGFLSTNSTCYDFNGDNLSFRIAPSAPCIVNVGSVGASRDNRIQFSYAVLDT